MCPLEQENLITCLNKCPSSALLPVWCLHGWKSVAKVPYRVVKMRGSALLCIKLLSALLWHFSTGSCRLVHAKMRHGSRFHCQKWVGSGLSRDELCSSRSTQPLGYWDVWKGAGKFEATHTIRWLVDRIVSSVRKGYNNKQTQYPQGISGNGKSLFIEENVS